MIMAVDLKDYIAADIARNNDYAGKSMWMDYLKGNLHSHLTCTYIKKLRYFEYYSNNKKSIFSKLRFLIAKHSFQRYQQKTQIFISPNVFEKGLCIQHPGYIWIDKSSVIGRNCTVMPRILIGKKKPGITSPSVFIGDNCYIGTSSTILGPVKIGNNVTIAAGSVVIHDIPDNCIVAGNPAKVIRENVPALRPE